MKELTFPDLPQCLKDLSAQYHVGEIDLEGYLKAIQLMVWQAEEAYKECHEDQMRADAEIAELE